MKAFGKSLLCLALLLGVSLWWVPAADAQSTTSGAIGGLILAQEGETPLPGASVTALHVPTGTRYTAISREDGRFLMPYVRAGGPYTVSAASAGFREQTINDLFIKLGDETKLTFQLTLETIAETVTVVGESSPLINPSKTGATSQVYREAIESLPTISRGFEDFARTNPFFSVSPDNDENSRLTVAGRNNRYNSISIDGAVNNDLFGLAGSGTPGGQTETTPISLDAIQELQLLVAPFDVRQGGFSGGGINAITRSGSNAFKGSVFYFTRDDSLVGDGPDDFQPLGTFDEEQYGFRFGGPLSKDKIFFFVNGEVADKNEPSGFSVGGATGQDFGHAAEAQRFQQIMQTQYGFDIGGLNEVTLPTASDKIFARADFNLATAHQLTLRHNFVDSEIGILRPSRSQFEFPSHGQEIRNETNSTVAQLNSVFGSNLFNEFRLTFQTIKDRRTGAQPFPYVLVRLPGGDRMVAGTERFSTANSLDQDILEITNDLTVLRGKHTLTFGTHNEIFSFDNLFIRENFGSYQFNSLDDLEAGIAAQFDHSFSLTSDPQQSAKFDVTLLSFYAGDQWAARDNLTLTFGLRLDIPLFPDDPSRNPVSEQAFGLRTDTTPDGNQVFSPRFGFNWDMTRDGKNQLRGGAGIFAGRTPFVWISNQYSNTGIEFGRIRVRGEIPFNSDPFNQPTQIGSLFTNEVDLIDPDFELPQIWRANLGYDRDLGIWGLTASAEVIYSETIQDIAYQNLNYVRSGEATFDGRPEFEVFDPSFTDVILLTNTSEGDQTSAAIKLERPFRNGIYGYVSYTFSESNVVNDGTSSQASSNWSRMETTGDPNNLPVSTSDFEIKDRFNAALSYQFNRQTRFPTTLALFYNAQSGRPYATTFDFNAGDRASVNGDFQDNDLLFVPSSADQVIVTGGTWADLDAYIEADAGLRSNRGRIVPRNASFAPWVHQLDLRLAQELPIRTTKLEITADIVNFGNMLDSNSGLVKYVNFSEVSPVRFDGIDAASGKPIYNLQSEALDPDSRFDVDDLRSRWQAKLGIRWSF